MAHEYTDLSALVRYDFFIIFHFGAYMSHPGDYNDLSQNRYFIRREIFKLACTL